LTNTKPQLGRYLLNNKKRIVALDLGRNRLPRLALGSCCGSGPQMGGFPWSFSK
jgi:hypothetical protein